MLTQIRPDQRPEISFEFFPAKTEEASASLLETARNLALYRPRFMSVTYGAGGSTRERTLDALVTIARETAIPMAGHLTCVNASKAEVDAVARSFHEAGIGHIVALRGDPPASEGGRYTPHPHGYRGAADLVAGLKKIAPFDISVAAYPETHPEAESAEADLENLKRKFDAGADQAITQFFFDAEIFLRFRDRAVAAGITKPIIPGILPIGNAALAWKFAQSCGASVPVWMRALFDGLDDQPRIRQQVAAVVADRLCQTLRREGVEHFHFYTLNHAQTPAALCQLLGVRTPAEMPSAVLAP